MRAADRISGARAADRITNWIYTNWIYTDWIYTDWIYADWIYDA